MLTIFGAVAELEREYILQRQREGIAIAKENGVYTGRKPIEHPQFTEIKDDKLVAVEGAREKDGRSDERIIFESIIVLLKDAFKNK